MAVLVLVCRLLLHLQLRSEATILLGRRSESPIVFHIGRFFVSVIFEHLANIAWWRCQIRRQSRLASEHHDLICEVLGMSNFIRYLFKIHLAHRIMLGPFDRRGLNHVAEKGRHFAIELFIQAFDQFSTCDDSLLSFTG